MHARAIFGPGSHDARLLSLREAGLSVQPWPDSGPDHRADLIAVLGGDGTIHRFLPQLLGAKLPVLLVPCGSGNDLARALNISSHQTSAALARAFVRGEVTIREIDLGMIVGEQGNEVPFCCVGGVGLDAIAAEFANRMPHWLRRHGGYRLGAARALGATRCLRLRICADRREIQRNSCLFSFANTPSFGGGLRIAPGAQLDDSKLDCILVDQMGRFRLAARAISLLNGTHVRKSEVSLFRAARLEIDSDPPTWVYADGEPVCKTPVEVGVLPRAMKFLSVS